MPLSFGPYKNRKMRPYYSPAAFLIVFLLLFSCDHGRRSGPVTNAANDPENVILLDSSKILTTLEMYRAPRYNSLEEALDSAEKVNKLVLHSQHLGVLRPEIGHLSYLATFDVAFNDLEALPEELSKLYYLQSFYANGNSFSEFPKQLLELPLLSRIDLSENRITSIPAAITGMEQLVRLSMDRNMLTSLPTELYELRNLEILEFKQNGLSSIPEGISALSKLKKLDLSHNQLDRLPSEVLSMGAHLKELHIQGNNFPAESVQWLIKSMPETQIRY